MAEKVSSQEIERLKKQRVHKNDFVDGVDAVDRGFGRIFSRIGKFLVDIW